MRLGDLDALKEDLKQYFSDGTLDSVSAKLAFNMILRKIDEAPTLEITNCGGQVVPDTLQGWRYEERPQGEWIPIKYRPMTSEERRKFAEHYGIEYCDTLEEKVFDCPMPEDKQSILISTSWGVDIDVADNDIDGEGFICYGLEGNGDWSGIIAWRPLPEPYKEGGAV